MSEPFLPASFDHVALWVADRDAIAALAIATGLQLANPVLARFETYDLLGLWTGDDRPAVLERAEGAAERGPDFVVELSVRKTGR